MAQRKFVLKIDYTPSTETTKECYKVGCVQATPTSHVPTAHLSSQEALLLTTRRYIEHAKNLNLNVSSLTTPSARKVLSEKTLKTIENLINN